MVVPIVIHEGLEGSHDFSHDLKEQGLDAHVDTSFLAGVLDEYGHDSIHVGCSVPSEIAVSVILAARERWPNLRFFRLSSDSHEWTMESEHYKITVGGTALDEERRKYHRAMTDEELAYLDPEMGILPFHMRIRSTYRLPEGPYTTVWYVNGPLDGETQNLPGTPTTLFKRLGTFQESVYELREASGRWEYHYLGKYYDVYPERRDKKTKGTSDGE